MKLGCAIALTVILASLSIPTPGAAGTAPAAQGLARIVINDDSDLARIEAAGIPVFARMRCEDGVALLAGTPPEDPTLGSHGLRADILDADIEGKTYFECFVFPNTPVPDWDDYGDVLYLENGHALLSMTPQDAERLAATGIELRAIITDPKPLTEATGDGFAPLSVTYDADVQDMIDAVESLTVYTYTGDLSGEWPVTVGGSPYTIQTRYTYSGTPITKATDFVGEHLEALGLPVEYHVWDDSGYPNVIAEIEGQVSPDSIVIICAHLDDMPASTVAPGADDNASGSVAVLMAADILSQYTWRYTLRFALWTGEEQGLYGSYYYARRSYLDGEDIIGVLNLDMIAYNTQGSQMDMDLHADQNGVPGSMDLAQLFVDVVNAYSLGLIPNIWEDGLTASDHSSFWNYNYTAILAIEDWDDFTPFYHTQNDLLQTLDMDFYVKFVKASVATFAHMGVVYEDLSGIDDVAGGAADAPGMTLLHPGRPNPTGSATVVRYDIASAGAVRLTVYDSRGRVVKTVVDRYHAAGTYEATWNGENEAGARTPPGVYFLSLRTSEGESSTRKVVLAR